MELVVVLMVLSAGWSNVQAFPVQDTQPDSHGSSTSDSKTVFEIIEDANNGINIPLREGDISDRLSRSAIDCEECLWGISPNGTVYVPYVISAEFTDSEISLITSAMREFEIMTCVKYVSRTAEIDYVSIEAGSGCWSVIGKYRGRQTVNLDRGRCVHYGVAQHELMHTLGFFHEHTRSDRDNYVRIMWQFIKEGERYCVEVKLAYGSVERVEVKGNFEKQDTNNLGVSYDYSSVMHYQRTAYSNTPGEATIVPIPDKSEPVGQRISMSHLDIVKINKLYDCKLCRIKLSADSGSFSSADVLPGHMGDNCLWLIQASNNKVYLQLSDIHIPSSSVCNDTYIKISDGSDISAPVLLSNICGNVTLPPLISSGSRILLELRINTKETPRFNATYTTVLHGATFTTDNGTLLSPRYPDNYPNNVDCLWTIIAPVETKVQLTFSSFTLQPANHCSDDYVTVIDGATITDADLGTFCGNNTPPTLVSSGNVMMVQFHSDSSLTFDGFMASYIFVNGN